MERPNSTCHRVYTCLLYTSIIDHGNIHGWLSNQINIASVREAAFIKDLLDTNSGDEAVNVVTAILDAFAVQGQACGVVAQDNLEDCLLYTSRCV